mgnify:CR=1 FL=1
MAEQKPLGKIRKPLTVIILMIVTMGIYAIIFWYQVFSELKNYRGQGWSGTLYLIFQFLFPFPLMALPWLVPSYIGKMYTEDGQTAPITGMAGFWIFVPMIGGIVLLVKIIRRMNEFWAAKGVAA